MKEKQLIRLLTSDEVREVYYDKAKEGPQGTTAAFSVGYHRDKTSRNPDSFTEECNYVPTWLLNGCALYPQTNYWGSDPFEYNEFSGVCPAFEYPSIEELRKTGIKIIDQDGELRMNGPYVPKWNMKSQADIVETKMIQGDLELSKEKHYPIFDNAFTTKKKRNGWFDKKTIAVGYDPKKIEYFDEYIDKKTNRRYAVGPADDKGNRRYIECTPANILVHEKEDGTVICAFEQACWKLPFDLNRDNYTILDFPNTLVSRIMNGILYDLIIPEEIRLSQKTNEDNNSRDEMGNTPTSEEIKSALMKVQSLLQNQQSAITGSEKGGFLQIQKDNKVMQKIIDELLKQMSGMGEIGKLASESVKSGVREDEIHTADKLIKDGGNRTDGSDELLQS